MAVPRISERARRYLVKKKSRYYIVFLTALVTAIAVTVPASPALATRTAQGSATTAGQVSAVTTLNASDAPAFATSTQAAASQTLHGSAGVTTAGNYEECLTNDSPECVSLTGTEIAIVASTVAGVASNLITGAGKVAIVYLVKKFLGWWDGPGSHTPTRLWSGYYEDGGDSGGAGANTNLCLADTELATSITFQPCGANGTVWIEEPDNDGGNYNFSRYFVNNGGCVINNPGYDSGGLCGVMTAGPLTNGTPLFLATPVGSGTADWQDWNP